MGYAVCLLIYLSHSALLMYGIHCMLLCLYFLSQDGCTALMLGASYGRQAAVEYLVQHGADIDIQDTVSEVRIGYGWTVGCEQTSCCVESECVVAVAVAAAVKPREQE